MRGPARHLSLSRYVTAGTVELGHEPPLSLDDGAKRQPPTRHAVSLRWLGGTVLTGFTSIFLMGGALVAALDNPNQFASLEDVLGTDVGEAGSELVFGQKSDRMQPLEEVATREILQVSTVTRQGERDFIKLRPFVKVEATLGAVDEEDSAKIPPYDVMRIFADNSALEPAFGGEGLEGQISEVAVDGEVSVKVSPFPIDNPGLETTGTLDTAAVEQVVRAATEFGGETDLTMAAAMAYSNDGEFGGDAGMVEGEDPFSALGVKIIPENVSSIAKSDLDGGLDTSVQEKIVTVTDRDTLEAILKKNDVVEEDADEIVAALADMIDVNGLGSGNKVRIAYVLDGDDGTTELPLRVSIYDEGAHQATVARSDDSGFVRADEPSSMAETVLVDSAANDDGVMPRVYNAVYQTALDQEVPPDLIDQFVRIFAFDVDFQSRTSPGDSLQIFHSLPDADDPEAGDPEILYAALTLNGVTKRFYRFRTADDGYVDYYDANGRSAKKFLMRKPLPGARISSNFGYRRHPILGRSLLHTGVDYGGRGYGAPILAAGDGIVEKAGRTSGYGNLIVVRHTNGYETYYGHQQKFAKGIAPGVRVRQGQVIGYVGSTGQSTGPHLHYEIRINGKPVDPLRIRLPEGRVLEDQMLAKFEEERQRIDALLGNEPVSTKVASN